jgi:hypothetical protein
MNDDNPLVHKSTIKVTEKVRYPIRIYCIVRDLSDTRDELIQEIREHTQNSGAMFMTRIYDSKKFSEDCNFIERLPAFHVYRNYSYIKTFYPNTRPLQHINESIDAYIQKLETKKRQSARWNKRVLSIVAWFKKLLHRKTRMEEYEEYQATLSRERSVDTNRFNNLRSSAKSISISDWN